MDLEKVEKETFIDLNGNERKQYCYELNYYLNDNNSDEDDYDEIIQYVAYPNRISLCKFGSDDVVMTNLKSLLRDVKGRIKYVINFDELQTTTIWVVAECTSEN